MQEVLRLLVAHGVSPREVAQFVASQRSSYWAAPHKREAVHNILERTASQFAGWGKGRDPILYKAVKAWAGHSLRGGNSPTRKLTMDGITRIDQVARLVQEPNI